MKKKIIAAAMGLALLSGTAYAAAPGVTVLVNGVRVQDGQNINGSTMLPLRSIGEALGVTVDWDNTKKQASITTPQQPVQEPQTGLSLEQLNKIGESVGLVYTYDGTGKLLGTGSGFVTDDMFITNAHVLEGGSVIEVWFGNAKQTINVSAAAFRDEDADLAGFEWSGAKSLKLNTGKLTKGEQVYTLAYPHRKFKIDDGTFEFNSAVNTIVVSADSEPGSSGGIVINDTGDVIGVIVGNNEGIEGAHAIPAQVLQNELDKL